MNSLPGTELGVVKRLALVDGAAEGGHASLAVEGFAFIVPEDDATALGSSEGLRREASSLERAALWTCGGTSNEMEDS